jgi:hypothetical protein
MGLSSLVVVANSLRLRRVGRGGTETVRPSRLARGRRALAVAVVVPVVLFGAATVGAELISPARGQSLLPTLPTIVSVSLPGGGQAQVYLTPGSPGPNELHLVLPQGASAPSVTASHDAGSRRILHQFTLSPGHFIDFVVIAPGTWRFSVTVDIHHRPVSFVITRTVSG